MKKNKIMKGKAMKDITTNIKYIGVNDNDIDLFEGQYNVPDGMTYNSYIILDDKVAVMDTVDKTKTADWLSNLENALEGRIPDYLVVSHLEEDHAGSIESLLSKYPQMQIVLNPVSARMFPQFFDIDISARTVLVKEGDTLELGKHTLKFIMASMVHWPEVMFTFETQTQILFTADGFGKFGSAKSEEEIIYKYSNNDEINWNEIWDDEARRYYINICGKYGAQVQAVINKLAGLGAEVKTMCPLHGPILTGDLSHYLEKYDKWSKYEAESDGTLIVYGTIHGNTEDAAKELYNKMLAQNKEVEIMDIARCDISEAISKAYKYKNLAIVCVTYNMSIFPNMNLFITLLKEKNFQNRNIAIVENGSWAPNAANVIKNVLGSLNGINIIEPIVTIKSKLKDQTLTQLFTLADNLGD